MSPVLSKSSITAFHSTIYENYRVAGRVFPWRTTTDPYAILVSEMMLQQTQTLRVIPKYEEWLKRFPDAASLSAASLIEVLKYWSGLGYNRRAVYLQKACNVVCRDYAGIFPDNVEKLEQLPGVGPYTARAVAAFSFGSAEVFVETNIRSVFIFFFFKDAVGQVADKDILPLVAETLDKNNPRQWYYALMDYGASLKKKVINPGRKSQGYVKQAKFAGSLRQARGAILRQLTKSGSMSLEQIADEENIDIYRLREASLRLLNEKIICEKEGIYTII
jgi:A/G-specific adenine glycosylase